MPDSSSPANIALIVVGVLVATGVLVVAMWGAFRDNERAERDSRFQRRLLRRGGLVYIFAAVFVTYEVATGQEPIYSLIGIPIPLLIGWLWFRAASKVKVRPR